MDLKAIVCDDSHYFELEKIIRDNKTMYGIDMNETGLTDEYISLIKQVVTEPKNNNKIIGILDKNQIKGFITYLPFEHWPFWLMGLGFYRGDISKNEIGKISKYAALLLRKAVEIAEQDQRYECFYIIRDQNQHRLNKTFDQDQYLKSRYDAIDIEILRPYQKSKHSAFNYYFRSMIGLQKKPVIIRQLHLKKEYRI